MDDDKRKFIHEMEDKKSQCCCWLKMLRKMLSNKMSKILYFFEREHVLWNYVKTHESNQILTLFNFIYKSRTKLSGLRKRLIFEKPWVFFARLSKDIQISLTNHVNKFLVILTWLLTFWYTHPAGCCLNILFSNKLSYDCSFIVILYPGIL